MSEPFTVELRLHGGKVLTITLSEDDIRERSDPRANMPAHAALRSGQGDERGRLRSAGYHVVRAALDPQKAHPDYPAGRTVTVTNDDGTWIVPLSSVQAICPIDQETAGQPRTFRGFGSVDASEPSSDAPPP